MTTPEWAKDIQKFTTDTGEVALSVKLVQELFCSKATPVEALTFLRVCQYQRLNPFLREVYLVKYSEGDPAAIVVGKDAFLKRAAADPNFDGIEAGIILGRRDEEVYIKGARKGPADNLLGGWCKVYRKDRRVPFEHEVAFDDYLQTRRDGSANRFWDRLPATMIRKVAMVQCLREAFPALYQGLQEEGEPWDSENVAAEGEQTSPVLPSREDIAEEMARDGAELFH